MIVGMPKQVFDFARELDEVKARGRAAGLSDQEIDQIVSNVDAIAKSSPIYGSIDWRLGKIAALVNQAARIS